MKLHYRTLGEGTPLIILHGLFGFSDNWQSYAKKLAEYFQVILVDLRNHGHSPWSDNFSYTLMADDVKELIDDLGIDSCILLGHSMGGKVAMLFAQKYEKNIEKLVVVDMGIKEYPMHHEHILDGLNALDFSQLKKRSDAAVILKKYIDSEGVRQFLLKNIYWVEKGKMAFRMNLPVLEREMPEILRAIPEKECMTDTLFIRGELSQYILDEDISQLERNFPMIELKTIPEAGHWVHAETPEKFLEVLLSFCLR